MIKRKPCLQKICVYLEIYCFQEHQLWKHGLFLSQKLIFKESFDVFKFTFIWW